MAFFESEQTEFDLSDEALFAEESNGFESPTEPEEPEEETEPETPDPPPAEEPKAAETKDTEPAERIAKLEKQLREANNGMTVGFQNNAKLKQQNDALQQQIRQLQDRLMQASKPKSEEEKIEWLQNFASDPDKIINEAVQRFAAPQVQQMQQQLEQQQQNARVSADIAAAKPEIAKLWPQLNDAEKNPEFTKALVEVSTNMTGSGTAWMRNPLLFMRMAAIEAWGMPKQIDQNAINAAMTQGKENALKELQQKTESKANAPAPAAVNPQAQTEPTEEERIIAEIEGATRGRFFGL